MTYDDPIRIYHSVPGDWGQAAAETDVYDGPADVQDGMATLRRLAEMGESEGASALCYLPPAAAAAFADIRLGDAVETPLGLAEVVGLRHTDAALVLAVTRSQPAEPTILA